MREHFGGLTSEGPLRKLFYDTEQGDEVHVAFVDPDDPDGAAFVVHEDGSVSSF